MSGIGRLWLSLAGILVILSLVLSRDNPNKNGVGSFTKSKDEKHSERGINGQANQKSFRGRDHKKSGESLGNCNLNQHEVDCSELGEECISCDLREDCIYGKNVTIPCRVKKGVDCRGDKEFDKDIVCQYCYQTPIWQQVCNAMKGCNSVGAPRNYYQANCTVNSKVICLGNRWFSRNMPCKWKNGYRWSTTLFLSVTLGGFGADRFYLGRWQEGIGKLFSFGGLGVWTIIDIVLIAVRYLGPADGSLYVD